MINRKHTEETLKKMSAVKLGEKNPLWRGDDVGYFGLHHWLRSRKPKPELCEECGVKPPQDCANISGQYLRDVNDYEWLCRRCHMIKDGRLEKIILRNKRGVKK